MSAEVGPYSADSSPVAGRSVTVDDVLNQLDRLADGPPPPGAGEGLSELKAWMAAERPPAVRAVNSPSPQEPEAALELHGYRGPAACTASGITYRQLDYWARTGLVEPSLRSPRDAPLYSVRDVVLLKAVKRMLDTGMALENIRTGLQDLRAFELDELGQMTLISDGAAVYQCITPEEVRAKLESREGSFGISMGIVLREAEHGLAQLSSEQGVPSSESRPYGRVDELAQRRNRVG